MPISSYTIRCYRAGCSQPAVYKIAAHWSDGITQELKTYSLACEACLPVLFREARRKRLACRLATGEILERPGIFRLHRGSRDQQLERLTDLEDALLDEER